MEISITGPRSVGKTTISKLVAKKLKLEYISSDELGEKAFKKYGGLDKVIKSGKIKEIMNKKGDGKQGYNIILNIYKKKKNFVFDLSGGSFTSRSMPKASEEVRKYSKNNSIVIGLLPSRCTLYTAILLFNRERKREHFRKSNKMKLFWRTMKKYPLIKNVIKEHANIIVYTQNKKPHKIAEEIIKRVKKK